MPSTVVDGVDELIHLGAFAVAQGARLLIASCKVNVHEGIVGGSHREKQSRNDCFGKSKTLGWG